MTGVIAGDIISGFKCSWCGVYFEKEHGYPVVCDSCWEDSSKKEREKSRIQKAIYKEL